MKILILLILLIKEELKYIVLSGILLVLESLLVKKDEISGILSVSGSFVVS